MTAAWLVSTAAGDRLPERSLDVALLSDVAALQSPATVAWMAAQGYTPDDSGECMYLALSPPPEGFPSRQLHLSPADRAAFRAALEDDAALRATLKAEGE